MDYEFHELANEFPLLTNTKRFRDLVDSIAECGQNNPVTLHEGKILDGRHRYLACKELGIEDLLTKEFENEPLADAGPGRYVFAQNAERMDFNDSQIALAAVRLLTTPFGRQPTRDLPKDELGSPTGEAKIVVDRERAAEIAGVSPRTIDRARRVSERGAPEVIEAVRSGKVTLRAAEPIVALEPEEQIRVIRSEYTGNDEWYTPADELDRVKKVLGTIDLDPASCEFAQEVVQAENYYIEEDNGLEQTWYGKVFLNPPFSRGKMEPFVIKLCQEFGLGDVEEAILLTNNFTDTKWFHLAANNSDALCLTEGRINFYNENGQSKNAANGHVYFYFGSNVARFVEVFSNRGTCFIKR